MQEAILCNVLLLEKYQRFFNIMDLLLSLHHSDHVVKSGAFTFSVSGIYSGYLQ